MTLTLAVLFALVVGTFWGNDEHFPFGPFRMYSTRNDPNGQISVIKLRGITMEGEAVELRSSKFGLRPAEVDGELILMSNDEPLATYLVAAYENLNQSPELAELRVIRGYHQFEGGRPVSYREETFSSWSRRP